MDAGAGQVALALLPEALVARPQRVQGALVRSEPKTRAGARTFLLPAVLVELLADHQRAQAEERKGWGADWEEHDLRHSCATFLIARGVHPRVVIKILGHSQISLTMNTYGHVQPETQRDATTKIAGKFGKREPKPKPEPEQPDQATEAEPEGPDSSGEPDEAPLSSDQTIAEAGEPGESEGQAPEPDDEQDQR